MDERSQQLAGLFHYRRLSEGELESYHRDGYLVYGPALTPEGLERMREECMDAWSREKGAFSPDKTWLQNGLLPDIHHNAAIVRDYYFHGPLVDVAEQVISPNIKGAASQLTFKMSGNTQRVDWHQDNGYGHLDPYNTISCLTALDDTDLSNGCLRIVPGSHRRGQIDVGEQGSAASKKAQISIEIDVDESEAVPVEMKAGECLFFHCWTLHASEGNTSPRDRRIVFLRYADADAVEVYNGGRPRLGRLLRGRTRFPEVAEFESGV